jgi:uncharacterized protein (TIGR02145 family)
MKKLFIRIFIVPLAFAAAFFFCCTDISTMKFPSEEELRQREGKLNSSSSDEGSSPSSSSNPAEASSSSGNGSPSAQSSSSAQSECAGVAFSPAYRFCYDGKLYDKCDGYEYNPAAQICENGGVVTVKCGGEAYNPLTHGCCGTAAFAQAEQFCQSPGIVKGLCGALTYTATQFCQSPGVVEELCGNAAYTDAEFCFDNGIYDKCGGTAGGAAYIPGTEQCCGSDKYAHPAQFCYNGSKSGDFCGNRTETYDPNKYECRPAVNPNGIYLKADIAYGGKAYKAVLIGEQTWMAENLNHAASGSKCGEGGNGSSLIDDDTPICDAYGRLYNWATAMGFDASCNTASCASQIDAEHKGVCPSGWHIPSEADWNALIKFIAPSCNISHLCHAAGKLKAASGWNKDANGTDDYGFAALPGCYGNGSIFYGAGGCGRWWYATEGAVNHAITLSLYSSADYDDSGLLLYIDDNDSYKNLFHSIRCVRNEEAQP